MKLLANLLLLISTVPVMAQITPQTAVKEAAQLFDGANAIVVRAPDSASLALQKMVGALVRQGYELDTIRPAYVTTKPRAFGAPVGGLSIPILYVYRVAAGPAAAGAQLLLTGHLIDDRNPKYHFEIPMRWVKPGDDLPDQQCFVYADKIAKAYPAEKVTYRQKKR